MLLSRGKSGLHFAKTHIYLAPISLFDSRNDFIVPTKNELGAIFSGDKRRREYLAGQSLIAMGMEDWAKDGTMPARAIRVSGRPVLLGTNSSQQSPYLSLSHSAGLVGCAVSTIPVGLDIELKQPRAISEMAELICSPAELLALSRVREVKYEELFYRIWTAKEAHYKLEGKMRFPEIGDFSGMGDGKDVTKHYWFDLPGNYTCALAIAGTVDMRTELRWFGANSASE